MTCSQDPGAQPSYAEASADKLYAHISLLIYTYSAHSFTGIYFGRFVNYYLND